MAQVIKRSKPALTRLEKLVTERQFDVPNEQRESVWMKFDREVRAAVLDNLDYTMGVEIEFDPYDRAYQITVGAHRDGVTVKDYDTVSVQVLIHELTCNQRSDSQSRNVIDQIVVAMVTATKRLQEETGKRLARLIELERKAGE